MPERAMSSPNVVVGIAHDRIQEIIDSISDLSYLLQRATATGGANTTTAAAADESNKNEVEEEEDVVKSSKRKQVERELEKQCKELQDMKSSLMKLQKFETGLYEPLQTLRANIEDILNDFDRVTDEVLPKQVWLNLQALKKNITRVKIQIPLQPLSTNAEAKRPWQTTVTTAEADDLPDLYGDDIFESSYYFKEVEAKYKELDDREKLCLLCFTIFPKNAVIKKRLLRLWWVGENLLAPAKDAKEEMELLSTTLGTFVDKGFIQPVQKENKWQPRSYKMNPVVHSCLIRFAKEARFFDYNEEGKPTMDFSSCNKACMVKSEKAPLEWFSKYLEGGEKEMLPIELMKLQMFFNFPNKETLESTSKQFDKLQTLFNISKQFPDLPKEWFSKMTGINVVYLGRWETTVGRHIEVEDIDFLRGFKYMKNLKLLSLQSISGIPRLPRAICKLPKLKILDLRACHDLDKLPKEIGQLKSLTYLDVSECYLLHGLPKQLRKLEELEVLKGFVVGNDRSSCNLYDLVALEKLRKLSVKVRIPRFDIEAAGEVLSRFKNLEKVKIAWGSGSLTEIDFMENIPSGEESKGKKPEEYEGGEAKPTKTTNYADQEGQNVDTTNSVASQVSEQQDHEKHAIGSQTFVAVMFVNRLRRLSQERKQKEREGLGKLVKLDLQCCPVRRQPTWLVPRKLTGLKNLTIRGGNLSGLFPEDRKESWNVEALRLKFLIHLKMDWEEMQKQFKHLKYFEIVKCPGITSCPCDESGVWQRP